MSASLGAKLRRRVGDIITILGESSWVLLCFFAVAALVFGGAIAYVPGAEELFDSTPGKLLAGGLIYTLVLFAVLLPVLSKGRAYISKLLGTHRGPDRSIWWRPLIAWFFYMGATLIVGALVTLTGLIDVDQAQETGFDDLKLPLEYIVAFVALVVFPPIAEELLFRGYMFGRLRQRFGFWVTTVVVSIVFGIVHMQWNVGIDVAILSVFLCYLRERTGTIWASMVVHGIKNGLAYYLLFIHPLFFEPIMGT